MSLNADTEMTVSAENGTTRTVLKIPNMDRGCMVVVAVVFSLVLNVALIATVSVLGHSSASHKHVTCDSVSCVTTSGAVASSLNKTHPACSDFYEYSCGDYKLHHNVEENEFTSSVWSDLMKTHAKRMRMSVEAADTTQKYAKEVRSLFKSCMDLTAINKTDSKPLLDMINNHDELQLPILAGDDWEDKFDLTKALAKLHKININSFFSLTKGPNPLRPSKVAFKIIPAGPNLDHMVYNSKQSWSQKYLDQYRTRLIDVVVKLGANKTIATRDIDDFIKFETSLAKIMPAYRTDIFEPLMKRYKAIIQDRFPITKFSWKDYMDGMFGKLAPAPLTIMFIENKEYFANLSSLISVTSDRTLANYVGLSAVYQLADHLPEHLAGQVKAHRIFDYEATPLYYQCISVTEKLMPWAAIRTMLDKKLIADKTPAKEVFQNTRVALLENLDKVQDKLSAGFTKQLKDRVLHLHEKLGYPDWVLKQDLVNKYYNRMPATLDIKQYFKNVLEMSKFRKMNLLLATEEKYEDGESWDYSFSSTGSYVLHGNDIQIPAYYMYEPIYAADMPPAFNYGGMGAWTAWYMVYALEDDYSIYHSDNGKILPIEPSEADQKAFEEMKSCYNYIENRTYTPPGHDKIKIGGSWGVDYLHYDFIAANMAYQAYKKSKAKVQYAPALPQDKDKLFFLAMGQFYCSSRYDPNSYYHKLLNGVAASRPEFTKAFGCQESDPLYNSGEKECYL